MKRTNITSDPCLRFWNAPGPSSPWKGLAAALTVLLALGLGCGRKTTYETGEGKVNISQKGDQATYEATTKDGKVTVSTGAGGVALPDNFPKDVPIYKGATVNTAMTQGKQMLVHLLVSAPPADAAKYYQDELKKNGWEVESTMNMGEMSMLSAKKEQRKCAVVAHKQDKGALVQISVE